jgi:hypothetical protein
MALQTVKLTLEPSRYKANALYSFIAHILKIQEQLVLWNLVHWCFRNRSFSENPPTFQNWDLSKHFYADENPDSTTLIRVPIRPDSGS